MVARYAKLLLGCYRAGDANDAEVYTGAVIAVLSDYPLDVIKAVVDPRTGIPSRIKWLPNVAEIKSACEDIEGPRRRTREWEKGAQAQLAERGKLAIADQRPRKTYEQIQAEFAAIGIIIGPKGNNAKPLDLGAFREQYKITQEQWDAIPTHAEDRANRDRQGLA